MVTDNFWLRALACGGIAIVLIGDSLALATHDSRGSSSGSRAPAPGALAPILPTLEAFVEQSRGLRFKEPVAIDLLSRKEITAKLRRGDGSGGGGGGDRAAFEGFLRALGLVRGPIDLNAAAAAVEEDGIVGFYDPKKKRLFVRGVDPTPFVRQVLVHELTHALDDQHFNLDRPALDDRNDESSESFRTLVEGSAVAVEQRFVASLSEAERQQASDEESAAGGSARDTIPDVVARLLSYPYVVGPRLVEALIQDGGEPRLEQALLNPPVTSEQTLHPDKFLAGEAAIPVAKPAPEGKVVDRGVLGEVALLLILEEVLPTPVARKAAAGWGGDQYVAWSSGAKTCLKWVIAMDTPTDTAELVSGLRTWEEKNPGASVQVGDTVVVTNCG
ncbi:MAG: hypothetical protein M3Z84_01850 [Actinomycetota bacterium]|nr:hypothetical protein [Actinomycetota bacterium]